MTTRRKVILTLALLPIALVALVVLAIPRLVDVDRYRPEVVAQIEKITGKRTDIAHLSLSILPSLAIRVDELSLANPPGFPEGHFLTARRVYGEMDAASLLQRQIVIKSLQLDQPVIQLLSDLRGRRNFDNPNSSGRFARVSLQSGPPFSLGIISKIKITNGQLTDAALLPSGAPGPVFFEADAIAAELENVDLNALISSPPVDVGLETTSSLTQSVTASQASLIRATSPTTGSAGEGMFKAQLLRFGDVRATSVKSRLRLGSRQIFFNDVKSDFYGGRAAGSLTSDFGAATTRYSAEAQFRGVDVASLLAAFPKARGKMTGKMEGTLTLEGEVTHSEDPWAGKHGKGQVIVRNGKLPTLRLNSNLMALARLADLGPASGDPSSFSSISADLNLANDRITSRAIKIVGNGVNIDASGGLVLAGDDLLEYEGVAQVRAGANGLANILTGLSGVQFTSGKLSFPFTLGGTLENPRFRLKGPGGATGTAGTGTVQPDVVEGIIDLLKKQTSKPKP